MLSLALIVKNEEKNLARCLDSAKGVWDELVIVDTGSTDRTVEIAKQYTDKVLHFTWIDDFAAARNFSFDHCSQPWIMWLDADDVLHPEDVKAIREGLPKAIEESQKEGKLLRYILFNYHYFVIPHEDAKEKGWSLKDEPNATLVRERIIKNGAARWVGRVHEHIPVTFDHSKSIEAAVWHMRDEEDRAADSNRNIRIMQLEVQERPTERNYYYLGNELSDTGKGPEAIEAYKKALEITNHIDTKFQSAFRIARIYKRMGQHDEAIEWFFKSFNYHVAYREPFIDLAQVYFDRNDFSKAVVWLEAALKIDRPENPIMITQKEYYSWLPYDRLAKAYFKMGRHNDSIEMLKKLWHETKNNGVFNDIANCEDAKLKTYKCPDKPVRLNLGCGNKRIEGDWIYCDLFPSDITDELFDFCEIPYANATVEAIYSEHSLEHVPRLKAEKAVAEWSRVMVPGGQLTLKIPDLELCCKKFVEDPKNRNNWWLYTLYGIQDHRHNENPFSDEVNYGQIHYTGWTKDSIKELLNKNGFEIDYLENYDGWDTPSIEVRAHKAKPDNCKRVAFINNSLIPRYFSYGDYWLDAFRVAGHMVDQFRYEEIAQLPAGYDLYFFIEVRYDPNNISDAAHPRVLYTQEDPSEHLGAFSYVATPNSDKVVDWVKAGHTVLNIPNQNHLQGVRSLVNAITPGEHPIPAIETTQGKNTVDIIIPSYKNLPYLKLAVESIRRNTDSYNLIVANCGEDLPVRDWLSQQTDIKVFDTYEKQSFSQNVNKGLTLSNNDVVVMNNDVIVGPGWLDALRESPYDITNPYSNCDKGWIHNFNQTVDGVTLGVNMTIDQVNTEALMSYEPNNSGTLDRPWVAFYATYIRRKVVDAVGLLSDDFINGCEDFDYCRRAVKQGFTCGHVFKSWVFHFGGKTRKISESEGQEQYQAEDSENQRIMAYRGKPTVAIYTGPAWERWTVKSINTTGIGGSETCAALLAKAFVDKGYRAIVIGDCEGMEGSYDGVEYLHHTRYEQFKNTNYIDHFISSRTVWPLANGIKNGQNYVWSHDIWIPGIQGGQVVPYSEKVDKFICLSPWHVDFFSNHHQVDKSKIYIQGNGLDTSRYDAYGTVEKDPYKLVYSSSPDRGLDTLLQMFGNWKKLFPKLTLHVFYGFYNWESAIRQRNNPAEIQRMETIKQLMKQDGVIYHGRVSQEELAKHQLTASIWAYPTLFTETYCITAIENMAAGVIPVTSSVAALQSTIPDGCGIKVGNPAEVEAAVVDLLSKPYTQQALRENGRKYVLENCGWSTIADNWINMFTKHSRA